MTMQPSLPTLVLSFLLAAATATPAPAQDTRPPDPSEVDGTVVARYDAELGFALAGPVAGVAVAAGDRVEAGQVLATLDERLVQAEAALAKLHAENETRVLAAEARLAALRAERAAAAAIRAAEAELNLAKLELELAKGELAVIAARWEAHRLKAPSAGIIEQVLISPGEVVQPGQPVLRLVDASQRFVEASIPSDRAEGLTAGRAVVLLPRRADRAEPIPAELVRLSSTVDPESDARAARFRILDDQAPLPVGSFVGIDLDPAPAPGNPGLPGTAGTAPPGGPASP